jgi:hypothetical protein
MDLGRLATDVSLTIAEGKGQAGVKEGGELLLLCNLPPRAANPDSLEGSTSDQSFII